MALTVRKLTAQDNNSLAPLFGAYLDFYNSARSPAAEERFLAGRLVATDSSCLGVYDGSEMAGFAICHHAYNSLRLAPAWILHDLFVAPSHRRRGVAKSLILAAHTLAADAGACEVVLSTAHDNKNAPALYETLGYHLDTKFRLYVRDLRS